jgi:hypothetical protein
MQAWYQFDTTRTRKGRDTRYLRGRTIGTIADKADDVIDQIQGTKD